MDDFPRAPRRSGIVWSVLAACSLPDLALAAVVLIGWLAFLVWTGDGPVGWRAKLCASVNLPSRSCLAFEADKPDKGGRVQ